MSDKSKTVVLIDDDEDDQLIFNTIIQKYFPKYRLKEFNSYEKAASFVKTEAENIDAFFIDLNMPKFNGIDCLNLLRNQKKFEDKKIIIYSTSKNPDDAKLCLKKGATDFMIKPSRVNEWVAALQNHL